MKITKIENVNTYLITTDKTKYTRYGPNNWFIAIDISEKSVTNNKKLESCFQEYMNKNNMLGKG